MIRFIAAVHESTGHNRLRCLVTLSRGLMRTGTSLVTVPGARKDKEGMLTPNITTLYAFSFWNMK